MGIGLLDYYAVLDGFHERLRPAVYLEIGVHEGHSLALARPGTRAIGVDPALPGSLTQPVAAELVGATSDEFFANHEPVAVDLAFIDGLHLFEQALLDFLNVERWAAPGATVLVHDCVPIDAVTSSRERTTVVWSGDVWKLLPCLRDHRPDLDIEVIDVAPTGLAVITNLDPASTVLADRYHDLLATYLPLDLELS
ncbi:MAG: class I SAM-dependent methyltransferase [Acidobacteria bacterium]|nr:class I SAM-dependent methyltransferase [Acidobacteriota bacterium]